MAPRPHPVSREYLFGRHKILFVNPISRQRFIRPRELSHKIRMSVFRGNVGRPFQPRLSSLPRGWAGWTSVGSAPPARQAHVAGPLAPSRSICTPGPAFERTTLAVSTSRASPPHSPLAHLTTLSPSFTKVLK